MECGELIGEWRCGGMIALAKGDGEEGVAAERSNAIPAGENGGWFIRHDGLHAGVFEEVGR